MAARNLYFRHALEGNMRIVRSVPRGLSYLAVDESGTRYRLYFHGSERVEAQHALDRAISNYNEGDRK